MIYIIFAYIYIILRYYFRINVSQLLTKLIKVATLVIVMRLDFAAIHRYFSQKSCGHHQRNSLVHVCLLTLSYVAVVSATLKAEHQLANATIAPNIIVFPSYNLCALTYIRTYAHKHTQNVYTHSTYP